MESEKIKLVKGDDQHGSEVIDYLQSIGGINEKDFRGTDRTLYYYVNPFKQLDCIFCQSSCVREAIGNGTAIIVNPKEYIKDDEGKTTPYYVVTISNDNGVSYINTFKDYDEALSDFQRRCSSFKRLKIPYNPKDIVETDHRLSVSVGGVRYTVQLSEAGDGMSININ